MNSQVTILGFAGSLRKKSYNKSLLNTAVELAPKNMKIETFDLEGIPRLIKTLKPSRPPLLESLKQESERPMPY
jgi:chromate reductase